MKPNWKQKFEQLYDFLFLMAVSFCISVLIIFRKVFFGSCHIQICDHCIAPKFWYYWFTHPEGQK